MKPVRRVGGPLMGTTDPRYAGYLCGLKMVRLKWEGLRLLVFVE